MQNSKTSLHSWMSFLIRWNNRMWGKAFSQYSQCECWVTVRRLAARDLVQVVRTNLERLEPLLFRTQLHRMWAIALRNGTLDRNAGRDSERVVRRFRETHAISAIVNSTTQDVSIIYQLLFINKKHNIPYKVYCVFHILRSSPKVLRNGFMYKHCIFAQILILKTSNYPAQNTT